MIANIFFEMLNNIKVYHWKTNSYARHKATDDLHSSMSDLVDEFVEVYIGKYGKEMVSSNKSITMQKLTDDNFQTFLQSCIKTLESGLNEYLDEYDTDLLNIRDEMLSLFNKTMYLSNLN